MILCNKRIISKRHSWKSFIIHIYNQHCIMFVMVNFSFLYIQLNPHTWVACDWVTSIEIIISLLLRQRDTSGSPSSLHMYDQQYAYMNGSNSKVFFATINSDFIPRTWAMLCNYITGSLQKTLTCPQIFHTALNFQNWNGLRW